jgi:hypothetical protein
MISELKDDEIMDFLMTSDFSDDYKPEELKYLLVKWRYFYRVLHGKYELQKTDSQQETKLLKDSNEALNNEIQRLKFELSNRDNLIHSLKNRKLTFKERLSGKIITDDEDK